ncbi:MAG: CRISPR-associated endonuclease Cas2 [Acidobacteria bacterium]|nr:CRISPR-associated endonuclease Cas2 [Acidobacteriota bacterium]
MRYVIAYDVPKNKVRARVAKLLEGEGYRVQGSVFECSLSATELEGLIRKLRLLLRQDSGADVRVYSLCRGCYSRSVGIGRLEEGAGGPRWKVF